MSFISTFRVVVLSLSLFFSVVILGLTAHYTQGSTVLLLTLFDFEVVALLAGCLSILILPVFLFIAATRKGAFTSKIVVELPTLSLLCILWIVASALTAEWSTLLYPFGCGGLATDTTSWCQQFSAIEGLSFVTWLLLFFYTATLLTYAVMAHSRGNPVWNVGVNETTFFDNPNTRADTSGMVLTSQHYQVNAPQGGMAGVPSPGTPVGVGSNTHSGYHPQV